MSYNTDNVDDILAKRISYLFERSELTQSEIAFKTGIERTALSKMKSGHRKVSADELNKLAKVFHVTTDYLLGNTNKKDENVSPDWATNDDKRDLASFLEYNNGSMMYQGENLTEEEQEKLEIAMTQIFWKRRKKDKK